MSSPKPAVLILFYTQTGQLLEILNNVVRDITDQAEVTYAAIQPLVPFHFPWKPYDFFNVMPEAVTHQPVALSPLEEHITNKHYDLVILGYQPWYLNPSLPVTSFLQSAEARFLKGKKVLTVIGARNMWLHAQERVKEYLLQLGAELVGNIALVDRNTNIISTLTVKRWAFKGRKQASGILPEAGVQQADILAARRFGQPIGAALHSHDCSHLHSDLLQLGAVGIRPGLVVLEHRGITNFRKFARYILEKGGPESEARTARVKLFGWLLNVLIFMLTPVSATTASIQSRLQKKRLAKEVAYFRSISFEPGKI